jgi:DNA polymerase III epsilon subunit-like protein
MLTCRPLLRPCEHHLSSKISKNGCFVLADACRHVKRRYEHTPNLSGAGENRESDTVSKNREVFLSVDVETAGPIPGEYSLLSIGACDVYDPANTFYVELKPTTRKFDVKALEVTGFSLEKLQSDGEDPLAAMEAFQRWILARCGDDASAVFVGFNASFDWAFVNYYFHRYVGSNPFGFAALDIKSLYMGAAKSTWAQTRSSQVSKHVNATKSGDHNALHDALYQAELFRLIKASEPGELTTKNI